MGDFTFSLFARPSAVEGVARVLDFGGRLNDYNYSPTPEEADQRALASDWNAVGNDLRQQMSQAEKDVRQSQRS